MNELPRHQPPPGTRSAGEPAGLERRVAMALMFRAELHQRMDALARAVRDDNHAWVIEEANALAVGAEALGLAALARSAAAVEHAAREREAALLRQALHDLQCGMHAALGTLRQAG